MGAIGKIIQKNVDELKNPLFYRALISEFVGTYLLIFIGCFSVFPWHQTNSTSQHDPSLVQVALCFGVLIGLLVTALSNVSGCHINPAVTIPMLLTRKITLIRAAFYLIAQMLGSIVAIYILKCLTPKSIYRSDFLMLASVQGVTDSQVLFAEAFITFLLVFTVYACCDSGKPYLKSSGPLSIGLSVTVGAFAAGEYTGGCMNPARAFGPAVIADDWGNQWIYWAGPVLGGIVAAFLYDIVFDTGTSLRKVKEFFTSADYDPDHFASKGPVVVLEGDELKRLQA